jgi:chemotaxis regulatin CheY-phosphate phosphatase CheZ
METARGRWFLKEYAARNRQADTDQILAAVARLESAVAGEGVMERVDRVRHDLVAMARSITGLKQELEASQRDQPSSSKIGQATTALDAIVHTTEQATGEILGATEAIQEIAWDLREQQFDEAVCDRIDRLATDIYTACTFQDLTAQRTQKVVQTLRFLEGRINGLIDAWETPGAMAASPPPARPARPGELPTLGMLPTPFDLSQTDVDSVIVDESGAPASAEHADADLPGHVREALVMHEIALDMDEQSAALPHGAVAAHASLPPDNLGDSDLMAYDDPVIVIDDEDLLELDLVEPGEAPEQLGVAATPAPPAADADEIIDIDDLGDPPEPDAAPMPRPAAAQIGPRAAAPSLAQIDAMPTTAKALLFG